MFNNAQTAQHGQTGIRADKQLVTILTGGIDYVLRYMVTVIQIGKLIGNDLHDSLTG